METQLESTTHNTTLKISTVVELKTAETTTLKRDYFAYFQR